MPFFFFVLDVGFGINSKKKFLGKCLVKKGEIFMSKKFLDAFHQASNFTLTENNAVARATTNSALLDFFAQGGAMRKRSEAEIASEFDKAFCEDRLLATKLAFYIRDVRGGLGERRTFRIILRHLAKVAPEVVIKNLELIPHYGRWDDLYALFDTQIEKEAGKLMAKQLARDIESDKPSLLAKWLKSENASSKETKRLARKTQRLLGLPPSIYRKVLSDLRKKIKIVERDMSLNNWNEINYSAVPSRASLIYKNAFMKHDPERYLEYINKLKSGEEKINASTLYPYELVREAYKDIYKTSGGLSQHERDIINSQWEALPDYIGEKTENSIAVVDTSGSMVGLPIQVALSVGLYLAERNKGPYHNKFITFSTRPQLITVRGSTFIDKVRNMIADGRDWEMNTDIEAVFDLILKVAIENHLKQDEIPKKIYIISDMEFDEATGNFKRGIFIAVKKTLFMQIQERFETHGYEMPQLVFWNVDARNKQFPMSLDERGFQLVSGCSPSIFEHTIKGEFLNPYDFMLSILNSERYEDIRV